MPSIGDSSLHMLNPYKFATWQFMRQYFSVSPQMYFQYPDVNPTKFSYNELLYRTILPFEAKFRRSAGDESQTVTIGGYTYDQRWAYNNIPYEYCLPRDFKNLRNPSDPYCDRKILSGNKAEIDSGTWRNSPAPSYANAGNSPDYYLSYHGSIFAAVIPVFTLNKVLKHKEIDTLTVNNIQYDIAPPNFFSTYTRTSYPQYQTYFSGCYMSIDSELPVYSSNKANDIFASTGLYPRYYGDRNVVMDGQQEGYASVPYSTYQGTVHSSLCYNYSNFVGKSYGSGYSTSAFRVLNNITNNIDTPEHDSVVLLESDMIYGMAHHTHTYIRATD